MSITLARTALFALAVVLTACAQNPVSGRPDLVLVSESEEIAIGRRENPKVRKEYGVYDDPTLQRHVNEVGQPLARASHRPGIQYHFTVVDSPEVNAFALPGGHIYVTRGRSRCGCASRGRRRALLSTSSVGARRSSASQPIS